MALTAALVITGIAIGLLLIYAADVAVAMSSDSDYGFLPLDHMQRGMGLGAPALILPIIAFFISLKEPSKGLGVMIIITGILIIMGGVAIMVNPSPSSETQGRQSQYRHFSDDRLPGAARFPPPREPGTGGY